MPCCGGNRRRWSRAVASATPLAPASPARVVDDSVVYFEYCGRTALSVRGPITGRSYRFADPGARVAVDRRDAASVSAVPNLKRV